MGRDSRYFSRTALEMSGHSLRNSEVGERGFWVILTESMMNISEIKNLGAPYGLHLTGEDVP